jgi:ketosteroid isomerase-like protein
MGTIISAWKVRGSILACLFAVLLIMWITGNQYSLSGEQKDTGGKKTEDEALVEKTIVDLVNASMQFPKTKDPKAILRFYSPDYVGINNGKPESVEDIAKYLSDVLEQLNLGAPLGISSKVANIRTGVSGPLAWATFDGEYKLGSGGVVLQTAQGPCTTIFRKQRDAWLIQHEHCSTTSQFPFAR